MAKKSRLILITLLVIIFAFLSGCASQISPAAVENAGEPSGNSQSAATESSQPQQQGEAAAETVEAEEVVPEQEEVNATAKEAPKADTPTASTAAPVNSEAQTAQESASDQTVLQIEGSGVEKSLKLSLDELKGMKEAYFEDDFFSLNSYGTKEYFHFKGIKLKALLDKAGLKKNASTVKCTASDGYSQEITIEHALREDYIDEQNPDKKYPVIIAWHENGQDYDVNRGAPFRLVLGQKEPGDVNKPQWVMNVVKITID
jgi:DMSO/TMAO reductase YedYZ molybdopterin-dependent catalytic subunit